MDARVRNRNKSSMKRISVPLRSRNLTSETKNYQYQYWQWVSAERSFGRSFRSGGGQFGAKFFAKFAAKFSTKFSALSCWDSQSKKNFSAKFPWPCTAKLEKIQGKNFTTRFCRGTLANTSTERQKCSQNLAPVLVMISRNSLVCSRKSITSTGFFAGAAPPARQHQ